MCEEKVEVEVQGVLEIHRNYTTRLLKNAPKNRVCPFIMGFFD